VSDMISLIIGLEFSLYRDRFRDLIFVGFDKKNQSLIQSLKRPKYWSLKLVSIETDLATEFFLSFTFKILISKSVSKVTEILVTKIGLYRDRFSKWFFFPFTLEILVSKSVSKVIEKFWSLNQSLYANFLVVSPWYQSYTSYDLS
jgi:hypothetical protein